jgi:hypothetical protein
MKEMDYVVLQRFLDGATIPKIKRKPKTFLGIAKQPHYENVLSNIYAFYFNTQEEHKLGNLFIKSLLELLGVKAPSNFTEFDITTEKTTNANGRIDLLLHNNEQAIIIENKVYHHLDNDLDDYWISVSTKNNSQKVGIVLSMFPVHHIKHKEFVNITHMQFITKVMENLGSYLLEANEKYVVFLKDLIQNIMNLSNPIMKEKDLAFYLDNQSKINQIAKFKGKVREHIYTQVELAGDKIPGLNLKKGRITDKQNNRLRYYVSPKHNELMITVLFKDLLVNGTLKLIVEVRGGLLKDKSKFENLVFEKEGGTYKPDMLNKGFHEDKNEIWGHYAVKSYKPSSIELEELADFIDKRLKDDGFIIVLRRMEKEVGA